MMFATVAAVVVALFKEAISKIIWKPSLQVSFSDDLGFDEKLNMNTDIPLASSYPCNLTFENIGNSEAIECMLFISRVQFKKKGGNNKWKELKTTKSMNLVRWGRDQVGKVDIPVSMSTTLEVFKIYPGSSQSLPSGKATDPKPTLDLHGFEIKPQSQQSGDWLVDYYLKCQMGKTKSFTLEISWNGTWKTRKEEMKECLTVNMNKK